MKLKSGSPYWPTATPFQEKYAPLAGSTRCDVAILGAGCTGALIAHALTKAGLDVVVLDKRDVGGGSTSASTALVLYEIDTPLLQLIAMRGRRHAVRSYECCRDAISKLEKITRELPDRCGFRSRPSLYLASDNRDVADLKNEFLERRTARFKVQFLERSEIEHLFSFTAPAAILSADAAEVNPLQVTRRAVQAAVRRGARVFERTGVTSIIERLRGVALRTASGHEVNARWIIVASGYETKSRVAWSVVKLRSTFALVTEPLRKFPRWHKRASIWETSRPYFYLRSTPDNRILMGGADVNICNPAKRDRLLPSKRRALMKRLHELFPDTRLRAALSWAGIFGETEDGLPYIGRAKRGSRILYALCYGANGINFAVLASEILRDEVFGKKNPDAKLFAFDR